MARVELKQRLLSRHQRHSLPLTQSEQLVNPGHWSTIEGDGHVVAEGEGVVVGEGVEEGDDVAAAEADGDADGVADGDPGCGEEDISGRAQLSAPHTQFCFPGHDACCCYIHVSELIIRFGGTYSSLCGMYLIGTSAITREAHFLNATPATTSHLRAVKAVTSVAEIRICRPVRVKFAL